MNLKKLAPALAVLLAVALIGILLTFAVGLCVGFPLSPKPVRPKVAPSPLKPALDRERMKNEELRATVERLEIDKQVLAQEGPTPAKVEKSADFRRRLCRAMKNMMGQGGFPDRLDAESKAEASAVLAETVKISLMRRKEPEAYADFLKGLYDVGMEIEGTALTEAQSSSLAALFENLSRELAMIPPVPAGERMLREIELEGSALTRLSALLTDTQRLSLARHNWNILAAGSMLSTAYVWGPDATKQVARIWSHEYQLDPEQMPQVGIAACGFVEAMNCWEARNKGSGRLTPNHQGSPLFYEFRLHAVREQLAALHRLQTSMTPAQQERLRNQELSVILLTDPLPQAAPNGK